jgi:hypothetical protein
MSVLPLPTAPGSAAVILNAADDEFAHFVDINPASFFASRNGA